MSATAHKPHRRAPDQFGANQPGDQLRTPHTAPPDTADNSASAAEERFREAKLQFAQLFDSLEGGRYFEARVNEAVKRNSPRILLNVNHLRKRAPERIDAILQGSTTDLLALESALSDYVSSVNPTFAREFEKFYVGLEGSFGANHVNPRTLVSDFLGHVVCVEGIVTKCHSVHPKLVKSVHFCPATKKTTERFYTDITSLDPMPSNFAYPTKDDQGNLLETEYGMCVYKDTQFFTLQELTEKAPTGQLPRSIGVICDEDLVDTIKPGDRVMVVGSYRCLPGKRNGFTNASFKTIILANNIKPIHHESLTTFVPEDIKKIKNFVKQQDNMFDTIAESIAPSISGHSYIKKAILCQLVGGCEKTLSNGTRLRGDINLMLMGDPSVAKSQFLRYVLNVAMRAIATTGRGSSGVGLTAAVTSDATTGERRLEAGAMVLADRGIVCIDEFDKMLDADKTAIHEVMEQGRVTIAKAGIQAQLNARCSVLAAANPVWGKYNEYKSPMDNIGMQDSLLSRFDLLFIVLDQPEEELDTKISEHVLQMHMYRPPNQQDGEALPLNFETENYSTNVPKTKSQGEGLQLYDKFNFSGSKTAKKVLSVDFVSKYVQIAKKVTPILTQEACTFISEQYASIRSRESELASGTAKTQPITPRVLETMIRLSTAHAKVRLSTEVQTEDAEFAVEMIQYCLFKKVLAKSKRTPKPKAKKSGETSDGDDDLSSSGGDDNDSVKSLMDDVCDGPSTKKQKPNSPEQKQKKAQDKGIATDSVQILDSIQELTQEQFEEARNFMSQLFTQNQGEMSIGLSNFTQNVNTAVKSGSKLSQPQIMQILERMENENQIMVVDDCIYLI